MKTRSLSVLALSIALILPLRAAPAPIEVIVSNDDDPIFAAPVRAEGPTLPSATFGAATLMPSLPAVQGMTDETMIAALCAGSSLAVTQSRLNAMAGLSGQATDSDSSHPAGWYLLPSTSTPVGLQWHHLITTAFSMWRGVVGTDLPTELVSERGGRLVLHATGTGPVNEYVCQINVSGISNLSATTVFPIGKDSAGNKIRFNVNFPGVNRGANGVVESTRDPLTGIWTVIGDDAVFTNGEDPDVVAYHCWYRFGATLSLTVGNPTAMNTIKDQFIIDMPNIAVRLIRSPLGSDPHVSTATVMAERAMLIATNAGLSMAGDQLVNIFVTSGQDDVLYRLVSRFGLDGAPIEWSDVEVSKNAYMFSGVQLSTMDVEEYFQARAVLPGELPLAFVPACVYERSSKRLKKSSR